MQTPSESDLGGSLIYESGNETVTPVQSEEQPGDNGEGGTNDSMHNLVADLASLTNEQLQEVKAVPTTHYIRN
jgi:hypothetical protein